MVKQTTLYINLCKLCQYWGIDFSTSVFGIDGNEMYNLKTYGLVGFPNTENHMKDYRCKPIKMFVPSMYRYEDSIDVDPWQKFFQGVEEPNNNHKKTIAALIWKVINKSIPYY